MVTQIINADQTAQPRVVSIPATEQAARTLLSALSVGKILPIVIHENFNNGQGLIFFQGQLLQALLPEGTPSGEELLAQVHNLKDKIVLRLLDGQSPQAQPRAPTPIPTDPLTVKIEAALKVVESATLTQAVDLPESLEDIPDAKAVIAKIATAAPPLEQLVTPTVVSRFLQQVSEGNIPKVFREVAESLRLIAGDPATKPNDILPQLRGELAALIRLVSSDQPENSVYLQKLDTLISLVEKDIGSSKHGGEERETLRGILRLLHLAKSQPEEMKTTLQSALQKLPPDSPARLTDPNRLDTTQTLKLQELATRLEQVASAQEFTNQLTPLLQSYGEPALLLFPFLFQNLMNHGEVTFHPKDGKKKQGEKEGKSSDGERAEAFQRIQLSVPLPSLGPVGIDIAVNPQEILGRFTVENESAAQFLTEQLEHLGAALSEYGYKKMDLSAQIGTVQSNIPEFITSLRGPTSVFA